MDKYFMDEASKEEEKSTCIRRKVGCVVVRDNKILLKAHNRQTGGIKPCTIVGCIRNECHIKPGEKREICRYICAEQVVVSDAARLGISLDNTTIYVTYFPCSICAKILVNAGIKKIVYLRDYPDKISKEFLDEANIPYEKMK